MDENLELRGKLEALERENRHLDAKVLEIYTLYNISKRLSVTTQLEEIFNGTLDMISGSLNIDDFCILLLDEAGEKLTIGGLHSDPEIREISFSVDEGITGRVARTGQFILLNDVSNHPEFMFYKGKKKDIGSFLCLPLKNKSGSVLGVMNIHKPEPNAFRG